MQAGALPVLVLKRSWNRASSRRVSSQLSKNSCRLWLEWDQPNRLDPLHAECIPGLPFHLGMLFLPSKLGLRSKNFSFKLFALEVMFNKGARGRLKSFGHPQGVYSKHSCERSFPRLPCQRIFGSCWASPVRAKEKLSFKVPLFPHSLWGHCQQGCQMN